MIPLKKEDSLEQGMEISDKYDAEGWVPENYIGSYGIQVAFHEIGHTGTSKDHGLKPLNPKGGREGFRHVSNFTYPNKKDGKEDGFDMKFCQSFPAIGSGFYEYYLKNKMLPVIREEYYIPSDLPPITRSHRNNDDRLKPVKCGCPDCNVNN